MDSYSRPIELIIQSPSVFAKSKGGGGPKSILKTFKEMGVPIEDFRKPASAPASKSKKKSIVPGALPPENFYVRTAVNGYELNPWDLAHISADAMKGAAGFIEPDLLHEVTIDRKVDEPYQKITARSFKKEAVSSTFDPDWQPHKDLVWHLGDAYSQLKSAREQVEAIDYTVRIGHIDTGYGKSHIVVPDSVKNHPLQRSFISGEKENEAWDRDTGGFLKQPGHGTATLALLAGKKIKMDTDAGLFQDYLGGAWFADVICCRISPTVILMKTSAFADAINYLTQLTLNGTPVHVVSMSMGGAPSKTWADAVNRAYEAGITMVTAAGNNFNGLPTKHVIYPARFARVLAACGVTYEYAPYASKKLGEMQGCYGPDRHMKKALAAFTPNTPWASIKSGKINFAGAGTSSATPQIAAAAAIYYRKYHQELDALAPWQRVEAIRYALFNSALKLVKKAGDTYDTYFGNGILQAHDALAISVRANLPKTAPDSMPWFPILTTIFKGPKPAASNRMQMFNTELGQLVFNYPELAMLIDNEEKPYENIGKRKWKKFTDAVIAHPKASASLKQFLKAGK